LTNSDAGQKSVAIRAQQIDSGAVCCVIEDSGPGIKAEHLPRRRTSRGTFLVSASASRSDSDEVNAQAPPCA
jgi:hypothetical protein